MIINKIREGLLRWFRHVRRRSQSAPVRRVEYLVVDSLRRRGRPKLRWEDRVKQDMKELLLSEDMTSDRITWRARISNDFKKCIHNVELEDIASSGLFFTWTKNLFKVKAGNNSGILKKLDKIMGSEEFIDKFGPAHFVFLSYLIPKSIHVIENHGSYSLKHTALSEVFSDEEIKVAMFQIDGNKAPGPDGFSSLFFKKAWKIVGKDICKSVREFFDYEKMLMEINFTLLFLIPKIQTPSKVECSEDFQYHFGCKRMKMTHVCFADDLLMFCHGDCKSVIVLKDAIDEFGEMAHGKAKVDWKNICKPKCQGGLGLKYLGIWNKAMIVKHLWHVASYKESLWVKWINTEKLKGKRIWSVNEEMNDNWGWRNILRLRNESFIAHRDLYNARFDDKFVVKDIVINGVCDWPTEWKAKYLILAQIQNVNIDPSKSDTMVWKNKKGIENKFYASQAYKDLQREGENVVWNRIVWKYSYEAMRVDTALQTLLTQSKSQGDAVAILSDAVAVADLEEAHGRFGRLTQLGLPNVQTVRKKGTSAFPS
ncbi:hypothetical protein Tco_0975161 [Tanacetum coccineum]|uniref:Reverse transcriptase domain-containing protein n=1 Tax=Tanacetum coccineum TaxID=301880 RepID=A0ABQ5EDL5_9ASTR